MFEHEVLAEGIEIFCGDCLEVLPALVAGSVDAILTDIPYGITACAWDVVIPLEPMWIVVKHVLKPCGAFVTTARQPFTSALVMSNRNWFKWADVWKKTQAVGHLNANIMPMRQHEDILVFGDGRVLFNPQITPKPKKDMRPITERTKQSDCYGEHNLRDSRKIGRDMSYPRSVVEIANVNNRERSDHPTQKPVALYKYLIRTYTNEKDTVLDFCFGSGTTGVACVQTGRKFVGIEIDENYYQIAKKRIVDELCKPKML